MANATALVQRAIDLSDAEDYAGALNLLSSAIAADPNNAQAHFERGMARLNLDQDAEAVADFDRALAIDPQFPGALDWRSRALAALGDHERAAADRLQDLRARPEGPHAGMGVSPQQWADCAEAFISAGNPARARELLEEYFADHARKVASYAHSETAPLRVLARLWIQSGDAGRACELAQRAYSSKHRCPADVLVYALALEASGNLLAARRVCTEACEMNDQMAGVRELRDRLAGGTAS